MKFSRVLSRSSGRDAAGSRPSQKIPPTVSAAAIRMSNQIMPRSPLHRHGRRGEKARRPASRPRRGTRAAQATDRKRVGQGKSVSESVALGDPRIITQKKTTKITQQQRKE